MRRNPARHLAAAIALITATGLAAACTSGAPNDTANAPTTSDASPSAAPTTTEAPTTSPTPPAAGEPPYNPSGADLAAMGKAQFLGSIPATLRKGSTKVMYLTFDDGPHPTYTPLVLAMLKKHNAKATFLVLGQNVKAHPSIMKDIYAAGHAVGSHTWDHKNLATLNAAAVGKEMDDTDAVLGVRTSCMRPPYGATNKAVREQLLAMDKWILHWDLGSGDWEGRSAQQISDTLVNGAKNGALTLMHDGGGKRDTTVAGVDDALTRLSADGWTFEPLPMCQLTPLT